MVYDRRAWLAAPFVSIDEYLSSLRTLMSRVAPSERACLR